MTPDPTADTTADADLYEPPFATDGGDALTHDEDAQAMEIAVSFVGRWNQLISQTNWEKGRIISDWRVALMESGSDPSQYSDEAWARRVGGVTAPHVGRLRRVFDRYGSTYQTYERLSWTHFLAALDWDDSPLWLEGASQEGWSVAQMRERRWQAHGAVDSQRPTNTQIIEVDTDEDVVLPAEGGGHTKAYGDTPGAASGKSYENADFGDEEELTAVVENKYPDLQGPVDREPSSPPLQPFAGLPELPDDLSDAIEMLKLAILRHKTAGWEQTSTDTVQRYLDAMSILMTAT
jgi:hypothetical protein